MLPRVTLISCAALVLFTVNTINAAPLNQKRFFGDAEDINEALDGYDFGSGDFTGVPLGNNDGLSVDGADTQLSEAFTKRDGDNRIGLGGGVHLPGDDFTKRDGDNRIGLGGGVHLPGDDFTKRT